MSDEMIGLEWEWGPDLTRQSAPGPALGQGGEHAPDGHPEPGHQLAHQQ